MPTLIIVGEALTLGNLQKALREHNKIKGTLFSFNDDSRINHGMWSTEDIKQEKQDTAKQHIRDMQRAIEFTTVPFFPENKEKPLHTYYCLFLPLGIYCSFGAENIHHAYNKAAKHWGARNQVGRPCDDMPQSKVQRDCRIYVFDDIKHVTITRTQVSHTLMTKLVKAWREENP